MGIPAENSGYLKDSVTAAAQKAKVDTIVNAAIANGIYVIIDWHKEKAFEHTAESVKFFQQMATQYGSYPNVIYEIYNEPAGTGVTWANHVKPYADTLIRAIREIDSLNLIVVGTTNYSQNVDAAARNPITGQTNIAYTLHFYAATHKQSLRNKAIAALDSGLALFATEWGTCAASGSGMIDLESTRDWMRFLDSNNISWCNWSINSKEETASALTTAATSKGKLEAGADYRIRYTGQSNASCLCRCRAI